MDHWEQARKQREFERELVQILDREEKVKVRWTELAKTLIPWIVTAIIFIWNSGGTWSATTSDLAAATRKVDALEAELRTNYVTKDDFKHVAEDVGIIKNLLMRYDRERRAERDQ